MLKQVLELPPATVLSNMIAKGGRTTWPHPRTSNGIVKMIMIIGVICTIWGVISILVWGIQLEWDIMALFGVICIIYGCKVVGSSVIVFDDNTKTIYIENKFWCYTKTATVTLGKCNEFKECVLHTEDLSDDNVTAASNQIHFVFLDGPHWNYGTKLAEAGTDKKVLENTIHEINEWWKTTNYYIAAKEIEDAEKMQVLHSGAVASEDVPLTHDQAHPPYSEEGQ